MSDLVIIHGDQLVTTTAAVAEGTGVQHKNVLELLRTYVGDLTEFGRVAFETLPFETAGGTQTREVALLNEDQATLLITYMRNNVVVRKFKIALVRSFADMRKRLAAPQIPDFMNPAAAARAWADELEAKQLAVVKVEQLEHQVAELAPAAAGLERIANADGAMCVTDAAKTLQMQPHKLRDALLEMAWMYRRQGRGGYVAYQDKIHSGYLKHKVGNYKDPETGENKTNPQVLVTSKGLAQLSKLLGASAPTPGPGRSPSRLS
ncbi:phage regulatory protein/antirepressor Ant [Massilia sp. YIM B02763]|uniref:phage regulatory protein/antirepressor Ant n=1 Tax=Massilia sp. YIM B02763 TaxID=3050130 RepID=UPI0025B728A3|nr:phage regulatory protein/antirepressor Ant [Massilia sp. YIM B02763]MDN4052878.1 phage regulatory protein/antirepressor Ant [Massilia sp. YIM B02763]